jgi:hypothetical protein
MLVRTPILLSLILLSASFAFTQDQSPEKSQTKHSQNKSADKKVLLPPDVLQAHTVLVLISPDAGVSMTDPSGNRFALQDVEKALLHWGRLTPIMEGSGSDTPDLVITIRKGSGKTVTPPVGGIPSNKRPVILEGDDDLIRIGVKRGPAPVTTDPTVQQDTGPSARTEVGPSEDLFEVYRGGVGYSLEGAPIWRCMAKGALRSPNVPAVEEFRKAFEEAEKQQKTKP